MFVYEKKLQYPVRIANPNPKLAAFIISQYGGPHCNWIYTTQGPGEFPGPFYYFFPFTTNPVNPAAFSFSSIGQVSHILAAQKRLE